MRLPCILGLRMKEITHNMSRHPAQLPHESEQPLLQRRLVRRQASLVDVPLHVIVQIFHRIEFRRIRRQVKQLDLLLTRLYPGLYLRLGVGAQLVHDQQNLPLRPTDQESQELEKDFRRERPLVRHKTHRALIADRRDLIDPQMWLRHLHGGTLAPAGITRTGMVVGLHANLIRPQNLRVVSLGLGLNGRIGILQPLFDFIGILVTRLAGGLFGGVAPALEILAHGA